ncbi:SAM-dependent methyltransferase [Mycolicibacterium hassiacum DSM 44199]|nr:SAM-dependent methyltransferase [Mycolicibacterium hassiacum DSM 44199]
MPQSRLGDARDEQWPSGISLIRDCRSITYAVGVSEQDRIRWDERYRNREAAPGSGGELPAVLALFESEFPHSGKGLDLACGSGEFSVWLARRGVDVVGVDISPTAIAQARELAAASGVSDRSRFEVVDLDTGLPAGPPADVQEGGTWCERQADGHSRELRSVRGVEHDRLSSLRLQRVGGVRGRHDRVRGGRSVPTQRLLVLG